jgi:hypothetical protein
VTFLFTDIEGSTRSQPYRELFKARHPDTWSCYYPDAAMICPLPKEREAVCGPI